MASRRHNVVVVLLHVAQDLEERHYGMAGVIRQIAREVAVGFDEPSEAGRCGCGGAIVQSRTGRPRKFCLACSPRRRKTLEKRDDLREQKPNQGRDAA